MTSQVDPVEKGKITFFQSHRPPLEDGTYEVRVSQTVKNTNRNAKPDAAFDETYTNTRTFQVRGERFAVASTEIESVFPPSGSQGEYSNVLPHIVFRRQTLPWERTVGDADGSSWLALMLFDENDPVPEVKTVMVGDLQRAPFPHSEGGPNEASNLPADAVSYPQLALEYGETFYQPCNVIDVPVALFGRTVPGAVDLPWLAHARTVRPESLARMGLGPDESLDLSVVVCNRLPDPNTQCTVHLVSLESMQPYLPTGDDYAPAKILLPNGRAAATVRLLTIASWSYRAVDPENTFSGLLEALDRKDNLRVFAIKNNSTGVSPANEYVANSLNMGYTPIDHHTRQGCTTVSWYRGPFVPFEVPPTIFIPVPGGTSGTTPIMTADEAVRYDPDNGMMDISYAAAWQIGRLLALQDAGFSQCVSWKQSNTRRVFEAFERRVMQERLGATLKLSSDERGDGLEMHHAVAEFIRTRLKPHLVGAAWDANQAMGETE